MFDRKVYTAEEIINLTKLKKEEDIIQGLLPCGVSILAASPKVGKSILATQIAISIANGTSLFGKFETRKGPCFYISLEESAFDIQRRLNHFKKDPNYVDEGNLKLRFSWQPLSQGGLDVLDNMLREMPQYKLVVIDTYGRCRDDGKGRGFSYGKDYSEGSELKNIATEHNVAILLLHHTVKASYKDWLNNLYGSIGIAAACDTSWYIDRKRGETDAILRLTGRKIADQFYSVKLSEDGTHWKYVNEHKDSELTVDREELLYVLDELKGPAKLKEIAARAKKKLAATNKLLTALISQKLVQRITHGVYKLTSEGEDTLRKLVG